MKFSSTFIAVPIIVLIGGIAAFAENSVPGDLLYGVKTSVNEPAIGIFAFSGEEKAEWEERLVERRLKEAEKLVSENKLGEANRTEIENSINAQIVKFKYSANAMSGDKDAGRLSDLNLRLEAALRTYGDILTTLGEKSNVETQAQTATFVSNLPTIKSGGSMLNENSDTATELLRSTILLYQKNKSSLSQNIQIKIEADLSGAEKALGSQQYDTAITLLDDAKLSIFSNWIKSGDDDKYESDSGESD